MRIHRSLAALAALAVLAIPAVAVAQPFADVSAGAAAIEFRPTLGNLGVEVSISGPEGFYERLSAGPGEVVSFSAFGADGNLRPAGSYVYELRAVPVVSETEREALAAAREGGGAEALRKAGKLPVEREAVGGAFALVEGAFVMAGETEPGAEGGFTPAPRGGSRLATKDQVIPDDLIVQGSICAGFDCVNNENFGFDTIRLKENNTRIDFTDTSSTSGFPTQDWEIAANDSASGGRNAFIVSDENTQLLVIESGNSANAVYVDNTGRVGFRTSNPVLDLHVATSNTPALRLEQTNAGGFTAQTWDVAGNEANFFVRDVTGGSRLSFRIRPGAPTSSIDIAADGQVGVGTAAPDRRLHVIDTDAPDNTVLEIENNGPTRLRINNASNGEVWNIGHQSPAGTGLVFSDVGDAVSEMSLDVAGNMTIAGMLTQGSSREIKADFGTVDPAAVLATVRALPIHTWSYLNQAEAARHLGPMAEDFHAAFGLGPDAQHIAPSDQAAVALAAIQGLAEQVQRKDLRIEELEARLAQIEELVQALTAR